MKRIEKSNTSKLVDTRQNQPFLEQKLKEANQLLKKVGLPKELQK